MGRGTSLGGFRPLKRSEQNLGGGGVALFRKIMDSRNFSHKVGFFMFLSNFCYSTPRCATRSTFGRAAVGVAIGAAW